MAFVYATGGNELFIEDVVVDIAKRVVTVRATLAGAQKMLLKMVKFHYLDYFTLELYGIDCIFSSCKQIFSIQQFDQNINQT